MVPPTYFAILALATSVLAIPDAGYHGHGMHQRPHRRDAPAAYGSSSPSTVIPYSTLDKTTSHSSTLISAGYSSSASIVNAVPTAYDSFSSEADAIPATTIRNTMVSTVTEQCGVVTVTATKEVPEYNAVSASSPTNSTHPAPNAYSSASYSVPVPSTNNSEETALSTTASAPAYTILSSSYEAAAVPTSASSAPAYSTPSSSATSEAAPVSTSTSLAITTAVSAIDYKIKDVVDTIATYSTSAVSSSTSATNSESSPVSSTGGKRGLAYNDASLTNCFTGGSEITWAYNWDSSAGDLASLNFIPTLWGSGSNFVDSWIENAKSAISSGSTTLFSFNEPDLPAQANIAPAAAAAAYKTYMNPLGDSVKLCAPSVTNSGTDGQGLSWLSEFLDACTDCQIDCINIHWYDSSENALYFKSHIEDATTIANGKPIYVSEFGATGSDEQISSFLQEVMPYMDNNSAIAGYAYFMVSNGVLVSGTEPSTYGTVYKFYSS